MIGTTLFAAHLVFVSPPVGPSAVAPSEESGLPTDPALEAEDSKRKAERPPRVDGVYFGGSLDFGVVLARPQNLVVDNPHYGAWGGLRLGQAVFRWLSLGVEGSGGIFLYPGERVLQGGAMFTPAFYPAPRYPFSIILGAGFGAGAVQDMAAGERDGFGGPLFMGAVRYEFFPGVEKRRPTRAGGFVIGPELGWRGFTPAGPGAPGQPMANTFFVGLWLGHYWGR